MHSLGRWGKLMVWGRHPPSESGGRFRARPFYFRLLPPGSADVLITRLPRRQDLAVQEIVVPVPVSFPLAPLSALCRCHGDDDLSLALWGDGAVRGRAALMFVFEFKGVTAIGWGRRGGGRGGWGGEGLSLRRLGRVGSRSGSGSYCCNLIGCHVLHLRGRGFGTFESVWVEDGLPLLGRFVDGELGCCCDRTGVIWCNWHTSHHHLGPRAPAVLLLQGRLHCDAVRGRDRVKGKEEGAFVYGQHSWKALGP